jgi:hypothetical protein
MNNKIEDIIKDTKYPLLLIYKIINNNNISDNNKFLIIKFLFKHHIMVAIEHNLLEIDKLEKNAPLTFHLIKDIYYIISKQLNIISHIVKFKKCYNRQFWKLDINKIIDYLKKLHNSFLCLYDGSKGAFYFHIRLKGMKNANNYPLEEMNDRLIKTYDMFKLNFFNEYKILLLSNYQFIDLTFENKIKYVEYIFTKINNILINIINYLILYDNYRLQLYNILYNQSNINIDVEDVNSDIEQDDLSFIVKRN